MACSLEDFEARRRHLVRGLSRIVQWKVVALAPHQERGTCDLMPATPYLVTRLGLTDCDAAIDLELEPAGAISACGLKRVVEGKVSMRDRIWVDRQPPDGAFHPPPRWPSARREAEERTEHGVARRHHKPGRPGADSTRVDQDQTGNVGTAPGEVKQSHVAAQRMADEQRPVKAVEKAGEPFEHVLHRPGAGPSGNRRLSVTGHVDGDDVTSLRQRIEHGVPERGGSAGAVE